MTGSWSPPPSRRPPAQQPEGWPPPRAGQPADPPRTPHYPQSQEQTPIPGGWQQPPARQYQPPPPQPYWPAQTPQPQPPDWEQPQYPGWQLPTPCGQPPGGWQNPTEPLQGGRRVWPWVLLVVLLIALQPLYVAVQLWLPERHDRDDDGYIDSEDAFPNDPDEHRDWDGDGIGDNADEDDDNDGVPDTADLDPWRDLAVVFHLEWVNVTTLVDSEDSLLFYAQLYHEDDYLATLDQDGELHDIRVARHMVLDWQAEINVPDDQPRYEINLRAFRAMRTGGELIDIDGSNATFGLTVTYDLLAGTWTGDETTGTLDGGADGRANESDARLGYHINTGSFGFLKTYRWDYDDETFVISYSFDPTSYTAYRELDHRVYHYSDFVEFATPDDPDVEAIAQQLRTHATEAGYTSPTAELNFLLHFVQSLKYAIDEVGGAIGEYPRFPVETLVDEMGDCEDTALLLISLAEALDYEAALILLPDATPTSGHAAAGLAGSGLGGTYFEKDGTRFFYAETTDRGWEVGEIPEINTDGVELYEVE